MTAVDSRSWLTQRGWKFKEAGSEQLCVQICPLCSNTNWKFFMNESNGLWDCKVCGRTGNLYKLKKELGIQDDNITSIKDAATHNEVPSPLPDIEKLHENLVEDAEYAEVYDYLEQRGFSDETIRKLKLGAELRPDKDDPSKNNMWVIIPYLDAADNAYYYKGRSVPPAKKMFKQPKGREATLYNERILVKDMPRLILTEGEMDCISLINQGIEEVVGVPGANVKKNHWIERIEVLSPAKIYILYDNDKVGQEAARDLAIKIGIEKVHNICLPKFKLGERDGKDINEWFLAGNTVKDFEDLVEQSKPFDVAGIQNVIDIIEQIQYDIEHGNDKPKYDTPWPSLTARCGGFEDGDVVGIVAPGKVGKTTMALNMLQYYASQGHPGFMFCQEMLPKRMVRKWVSHVTKVEDNPGNSKINKDVVANALGIAKNMPADLLFGYTPTCSTNEVFSTIRQAVKRYGVKVVCFDNFQMMMRSLDHSAQEASNISKMFKAITMELNILMLLIIQPRQMVEGKKVTSDHVFGTSALSKDVDHMICLNRDRIGGDNNSQYMETDSNLDPMTHVRVDLSRYAAGGICTLWMDGATSTVREYVKDPTNVGFTPTGNDYVVAI